MNDYIFELVYHVDLLMGEAAHRVLFSTCVFD